MTVSTPAPRPLGGLECMFPLRHDHKSTCCLLSGVKYNTAFTKETLYPALTALVEAEPALSLNVVTVQKLKEYQWKRLDTIDLDRVVEFKPEWTRQDITQWQFETRASLSYDCEDPLWRVYVIDECTTLALVNEHVIMDGMSLVFFHEALSALVNKQLPFKGSVVPGCQNPLSLPMDAVLDLDPIVAKLEDSAERVGEQLVYTPNEQSAPQFTILDLDETQVRAMRDLGHTHGFSVTALLRTLVAWAVLDVYTSEAQKATNLGILNLTPLNARYYLGSELSRALGNYYIFTDYSSPGYIYNELQTKTQILGLAKRLGHHLKTEVLPLKEKNGLMVTNAAIKSRGIAPHGEPGENVADGFVVSNLGILNLVSGHVQGQSAFFCQVPAKGFVRTFVSAITVAGGPMAVQLTALEDPDKTVSERFRAAFTKALDICLA